MAGKTRKERNLKIEHAERFWIWYARGCADVQVPCLDRFGWRGYVTMIGQWRIVFNLQQFVSTCFLSQHISLMPDAQIRLAAELWSTGSRRKTCLTVARHKDSERPFSAQLPRSWKDSKWCTEWHLESSTVTFVLLSNPSRLYYCLHPAAFEATKPQDLRGALPKRIQLWRGQSCFMSFELTYTAHASWTDRQNFDSRFIFGKLGVGLLDSNLIMPEWCWPVLTCAASWKYPWHALAVLAALNVHSHIDTWYLLIPSYLMPSYALILFQRESCTSISNWYFESFESVSVNC